MISLQSERLLLRTLLPSDSKDFFRYRSDTDTNKYLNFVPLTLKDAQDFVKRQPKQFNQTGTWFQLGIFLSAQLIGDIGLHFVDDDQVEIGYTLNPAFRGAGYMQEALERIISYIFKDLSKHRVFASVDPENSPSVKLLQKLEFRKEAHHVKSLWFKGTWVDDVIFAMLNSEFNNHHAS